MASFNSWLLPVVLLSITTFLQKSFSTAVEHPCHYELTDVISGVLQPDSKVLSYDSCSWRISASTEKRLVINVNSLKLSGNATLTIIIDKNETTYTRIPCGSWSNRQFVGSTVQIMFNHLSENRDYINNDNDTTATRSPILQAPKILASTQPEDCEKAMFSINYTSFHPRECGTALSPVNGFVVGGKTRRIGDKIQYQCHTPYILEKSSISIATCVLNSETPMPMWSNSPPYCILPECGKIPIKIPLGDGQNKTVLKHEGFKFGKASNCMWEITTGRRKHLVVRVEHLNLPMWTAKGKQEGGAALEIYDGKISDKRRLARLSGSVGSNASNYTTIFNKLIVSLRISNFPAFVQTLESDPLANEMEDDQHYGFSIIVMSKTPSCQFPKAPINGDVREVNLPAEVGKPNSETEVNLSILFSCNTGYNLTGAEHASCMENGQWSDPVPVCIPLSPSPVATTSVAIAFTNVEAINTANVPEVISDKSLQSRISKNRRPHPQSTEEKTNLKPGKEDSISKQQNANATPLPTIHSNITDDIFSEDYDDEVSSGSNFPEYPSSIDEFDDAFSNYENEGDRGDAGNEFFSDEDIVRDNGSDGREFPVIAVILGVGIPLIFVVVAVAGFVVYRRLYPVRMSLGRKFETFENPAYGRSKRGAGTPLGGTLSAGASLAQSPAELQRLTRQNLP